MMPLSDFCYQTWIVRSRVIKELGILGSEVMDTDRKILLDAGAGADEHYFKAYAGRGLKTIRMDISVDNLKTGSSNNNADAAHLIAGDVNRLPLAAGSVDILFLCEVLEHLNTPEQALKEAYRVLKQGGYLFMDVPWLHEVYRPLSAIVLRNLAAFKRTGRPSWPLKILYQNPGEIGRLRNGASLRRTRAGSLLIRFARIFPTFRSLDPESFVYQYYHGALPEGDIHLQFRSPGEWTETVRRAGFKPVKKTGAFLSPPPFSHSKLCNWLSSKLERCMRDNLLFRLCQILIIVAVKA